MTEHRGGVDAENYVLHNPNRPMHVYCGRLRSSVNRCVDPDKLTEDEGCRSCVRRRSGEGRQRK